MSTSETHQTVVVIEDDIATSRLIAKSLSSAGYHVVECKDAESGTTCIRENHPVVVCLDLALPTDSGYVVAEWMRAHREYDNTPIVVITGRTGLDNLSRAMEVGVDEVLTKPFRPAELVQCVDQCSRAGRVKC